MLAHFLDQPSSWVAAHPEFSLKPELEASLTKALAQLKTDKPLPYIIGHWEFFGLDFSISPAVLIPRPETELVVEEAIHWLQSHPERHLAADIGTGSCCIAISVAKHIEDIKIYASDISHKALHVAQHNVDHHNMNNQIELVQSKLLNAFYGAFDLICANLPYIPSRTLKELKVSRYEPPLALDGGYDGLNLIKGLLSGAPRLLSPGGLLLIEIETGQKEAAAQFACDIFPFASIQILNDLAGNPRLLRIESK